MMKSTNVKKNRALPIVVAIFGLGFFTLVFLSFYQYQLNRRNGAIAQVLRLNTASIEKDLEDNKKLVATLSDQLRQARTDSVNMKLVLEREFAQKQSDLKTQYDKALVALAFEKQELLRQKKILQHEILLAQNNRIETENTKMTAVNEKNKIISDAEAIKNYASVLQKQTEAKLDAAVMREKNNIEYRKVNLEIMKAASDKMKQLFTSYDKAEGFSIDIVEKRIIENYPTLASSLKTCQAFDAILVDEEVKSAVVECEAALKRAKKIAKIR